MEALTPTFVENLFSPCGSDNFPNIVNYVIYEWASKATSIAFNFSFPLLINQLGNASFGNNQGKIAWSYINSIASVFTALSYLTFTSVLEYGRMKRKALVRFSYTASIFLVLFVFCFYPGTVYLAAFLAVGCKVSQSIASIAYDSLLDAVSAGKMAHAISSRGSITGYTGMIAFLICAAPIVAIIYFAKSPHPSTLWLEGIIPLVLMGLWYFVFLVKIDFRLDKDLGKGPTFPRCSGLHDSADALKSTNTGSEGSFKHLIRLIYFGFVQGAKMQIKNIREVTKFTDLSWFIVAFIFLSAASTTGSSVAILIATSVLGASFRVLLVAFIVGIACAIAGTAAYKQLIACGLLTPKWALVANIVVIILVMVYSLFITGTSGIYIVAAVGGSQIGSLGAFPRSIVSSLVPSTRQSRLFSLYQFSQESTGWIGSLIVASVTKANGGSSQAYLQAVVISTLVEIGIGLPCLLMMNFERGEAFRRDIERHDREATVGAGGDLCDFGMELATVPHEHLARQLQVHDAAPIAGRAAADAEVDVDDVDVVAEADAQAQAGAILNPLGSA